MSRIVVVGLGDSITAGNPGYDPDPARQPFEGDDLPWNRGWPGGEAPIRELNRRIREIGAAETVTLLALHDTLEDPERPGRIKEGWTEDGNHPNVPGHRRLGELAFVLPPGHESQPEG